MRLDMLDAQQALGFVTPQFYNIESKIYEIKYPDFAFEDLVPVITEGNPWARGTLFYSLDQAGKAEWINGGAFDMPYADVSRTQLTAGFYLAGIGYEWNLEEISLAQMEGIPLSDYKARAARKAAQQFLWNVAMLGKGDGTNSEKGWTGLINNASAAAADVTANGTGSTTWWANKTPDQILQDINGGITGVFTSTYETEMADTVLLPTSIYNYLASTPRSSTSDVTILNYLLANNAYTAQTGQRLLVRALRVLDTADPGGDGRAVVYKRDPEVLRFHLPMPHRFLAPFQKGSMVYEVAGILRTGGLEVRLPKAVRYLDGILDS